MKLAVLLELKSLAGSQEWFRDADLDGDGSPDYATLTELAVHGFYEFPVGGTKHGYRLTMSIGDQGWHAHAAPESGAGTFYFIDDSGILRRAVDAFAGPESPRILE